MDIRLHIGVHRSATRHLRAMLSMNRDMLLEQGIRVLDPEYAEKAFARAIKDVRDGKPMDAINSELMSKLTADMDVRRIVMIDPNIAGQYRFPASVFG